MSLDAKASLTRVHSDGHSGTRSHTTTRAAGPAARAARSAPDADVHRSGAGREDAHERSRLRPRPRSPGPARTACAEPPPPRRPPPPTPRSPAPSPRAAALRCRSASSPTCAWRPRSCAAAFGGWARSPAAWTVPPTIVEGAPLGQEGIAGVHVIGARGTARPLVEGDAVYGTLVETKDARILGLSDVGRRAASRLAARSRRGRGRRDRRGGGAPRPRGLLVPRRRADLVLPARHPGLVRARSTRCGTLPSGGWDSWARPATARSRRARASRVATRAAAGARSTSSRCSRAGRRRASR